MNTTGRTNPARLQMTDYLIRHTDKLMDLLGVALACYETPQTGLLADQTVTGDPYRAALDKDRWSWGADQSMCFFTGERRKQTRLGLTFDPIQGSGKRQMFRTCTSQDPCPSLYKARHTS